MILVYLDPITPRFYVAVTSIVLLISNAYYSPIQATVVQAKLAKKAKKKKKKAQKATEGGAGDASVLENGDAEEAEATPATPATEKKKKKPQPYVSRILSKTISQRIKLGQISFSLKPRQEKRSFCWRK